MTVGRRLFKYAWLYKGALLGALLMLVVAVGSELCGPFIAKTMIDRHILGIEQPWYRTTAETQGAVLYHGQFYVRADRLQPGQAHGPEVHILQVGRSFYFIPSALPFDGVRVLNGTQLTITHGSQHVTVQAVPLTRGELLAFYRPDVPALWQLAGLYLALLAISSLFTYGQQWLFQVAANRILQRMRLDVFAHIQCVPIAYFDRTPAGKVVSRITNDTETIRDLFVTVLANICSSVIYMAGIYFALFLLDAVMACICLLLVPLLMLWIWAYRRYAVRVNQRIRALVADINAMIHEMVQGMPVIHAFHREEAVRAEFESLNDRQFLEQNRLLRVNSATGFNLAGALRNVFFLALLSYFGWRSLHLSTVISFGALYAFIDCLTRLFQPVVQVVNQLANLEQSRVSAERVFELLDEPGEPLVDADAVPRFRGDIEFDQVHFSYDGKHEVLKGISFTARQGQTVAIVGHTGSGKSSIMNLLFRFYNPQSGTIRLDGVDITTLPRQQVRRNLGIVLQDPFLFTGTVADNVSLGDPRITRERVQWALAELGADQVLAHLPGGLDAPVLEQGRTLSAGQRQLISFARALAFDPAVLVLDEATSSIDTETEAAIQAALDVLKRGRTTLIIAHRLSTIRHADVILVLDRGVIVERGSHEELMARRGRYYQMYQLQHSLLPETSASSHRA
ncbi:multidrug ABC transporter permease [Alicyclobacillus contaminans]|uniref:ABC transporter ATP-binding protein n=1 Tax=Alicyclobacillus contaminans TaxID=392016 RepID=UPI00041C3B1B|nr:ABC transporter ATP-binding protein [Alicyclobacillus contaminans]GMA49801.1 multidrug ABC transporter permease [Alicyclobacillus contaminans]